MALLGNVDRMASPFPRSSSASGEGHLHVQLLPHGISALSKMTFQYPLKLISPSPTAAQKSVLVFLLTYGGGLVGGDHVHLHVTIAPHAKLSIVTQGHTKVFKSSSRDVVTRQKMEVSISKWAGLCLLPDPVQPFEESVYEQYQIFKLAEGASLCLLDWVSAGRTARGENWDLWAWTGRNEVWAEENGTQKRLLLRDNIILEGDDPSDKERTLRAKMHHHEIFGTLILKGPMFESLAAFFTAEFVILPRIGGRDFRSQAKKEVDQNRIISKVERWRSTRIEHEKAGNVLWSAAKVRGCTVVKFGARTVEDGRDWIGSMLKQEGSVAQCFGEDATMCVK